MKAVMSLPAAYSELAEAVERDAGAIQAAIAYRRAAELAQNAIEAILLETYSLDEAEQESGYTRKALRRAMRDGRLSYIGDLDDDPRIPRWALPRKIGHGVSPAPRLADIDDARPSSRVQAARERLGEE